MHNAVRHCQPPAPGGAAAPEDGPPDHADVTGPLPLCPLGGVGLKVPAPARTSGVPTMAAGMYQLLEHSGEVGLMMKGGTRGAGGRHGR